MKKTIFSFVIIIILWLSTFQAFIAKTQTNTNTTHEITNIEKDIQKVSLTNQITMPTARLVPIQIQGHGYIMTTLFYLALIPMVFSQILNLVLNLLDSFIDLTFISDFFYFHIPQLMRNLADVRDTFAPFFLSCPYIHVNQHGGTFKIGSENGISFNGVIFGFTGIAWERNNGSILINGFARKVVYTTP